MAEEDSMNWFRTENIYWGRLSFITGLLLVVWGGMAHFFPPNVFEHVSIVLGVVQGALTFIMHSGSDVK